MTGFVGTNQALRPNRGPTAQKHHSLRREHMVLYRLGQVQAWLDADLALSEEISKGQTKKIGPNGLS
jgi:hypothetical protein